MGLMYIDAVLLANFLNWATKSLSISKIAFLLSKTTFGNDKSRVMNLFRNRRK